MLIRCCIELMFNQNRIYRIFRLINFLKASPPKTRSSLATLIGVSSRSVYRYFDLLEQLGIELQKDVHGKYFIDHKEFDEAWNLTPQEAEFLMQLLHTVGRGNPLKESIARKMGKYSELEQGTHTFYQAHLGEIVKKLSTAIQSKKQVILKAYYSASSQTITDRRVEPMKFTDRYESISAFEVDSQTNKYFNIERISDVEILTDDMEFELQHEFHLPDIFGFQGKEEPLEVEWTMSLRASLLLKEEYPMSRSVIKPIQGTGDYHFKAQVHSFKGPGRFVMGFLEDVEVKGSEAFKTYLKNLMRDKF